MTYKGVRFLFYFVLTVAWLRLMRNMTAPLEPGLIIEFEFIGTAQKAIAFLSALEANGQLELLTRSIYLDFIFPLLYGATLYHATLWICSKLPEGHVFNQLRNISILTGIAVICDFLENLSLLKLLYYPPENIYAYAAYFFAAAKFMLLGLVIVHFILSGLIAIKKSKKSALKY